MPERTATNAASYTTWGDTIRKSVYLDKQMQKMVDAASATGRPLNVVVSPKTDVVSAPLRDAVAQTRGKVYSRGTDGAYEVWGVGK